MLLVWLRRQECFEEPFAIMDLPNVSNLLKRGNTLPHDGRFTWAVVDFSYGNWASGTSVDNARVVLDRDKLPFIVEYQPILLQQAINLLLDAWREMGEVHLLAQRRAML